MVFSRNNRPQIVVIMGTSNNDPILVNPDMFLQTSPDRNSREPEMVIFVEAPERRAYGLGLRAAGG